MYPAYQAERYRYELCGFKQTLGISKLFNIKQEVQCERTGYEDITNQARTENKYQVLLLLLQCSVLCACQVWTAIKFLKCFEFLVSPGPHVRTAVSVHEINGTGRNLSEIEPVKNIILSSRVRSIQGGHRPVVVIVGEIMEDARTVITHLAKLGFDRSVKLTDR